MIRAARSAVQGRAWVAHLRSTPFFTLLARMKAPLRAKKNAAMVRFTLEPRLMAALTCSKDDMMSHPAEIKAIMTITLVCQMFQPTFVCSLPMTRGTRIQHYVMATAAGIYTRSIVIGALHSFVCSVSKHRGTHTKCCIRTHAQLGVQGVNNQRHAHKSCKPLFVGCQ